MNERIELLLVKAIQESNSAVKNETYEKFAELLIKECSKVASDFVTDYNSKLLDDYTISAWHLSVHIENHFGIEE